MRKLAPLFGWFLFWRFIWSILPKAEKDSNCISWLLLFPPVLLSVFIFVIVCAFSFSIKVSDFHCSQDALGFCGKHGFIYITDTLKYNPRVSVRETQDLNPVSPSLWVSESAEGRMTWQWLVYIWPRGKEVEKRQTSLKLFLRKSPFFSFFFMPHITA